MAQTKSFRVYTGMGRSNDWKKLGLTAEQCEILDDIGYGTNKAYGHDQEGFANFLNALDPTVQYQVSSVRQNPAECSAEYLVTRLILSNGESPEGVLVLENTSEELIAYLKQHPNKTFKMTLEEIVEPVVEEDAAVDFAEQRKQDEATKRQQLLLQEEKRKLEDRLYQINRQIL